MYDTLIFDLDGTLLYTLEDLHDAANHVLGKNGYPSPFRWKWAENADEEKSSKGY